MLIITADERVYAAHFTHGTVEYLRWRCVCGSRSPVIWIPLVDDGRPLGEKNAADREFDALWDSHLAAALAQDPESQHSEVLWDRWTRRATWATVHRERCENKRPCTQGDAVTERTECSVDGRFEKARGRKLALARALISAGFTKVERAAIWRSYRGSFGMTSHSHRAKPPGECLVCRRLDALCHRHGGPSRSTSFRGKTGKNGRVCTRCRWPVGHAARCSLAPVGCKGR